MSFSWLWDTRRGSACRKCISCSFYCMYPYCFFLQCLLHEFLWARQNKVGNLFSTLYLMGLCFRLCPSGKAVFKHVRFLMDFSLSGFSCKSELCTGRFIFPSCFLLERFHKLHFWEKGKDFLKEVFIWLIALLFKFPISRCWMTPRAKVLSLLGDGPPLVCNKITRQYSCTDKWLLSEGKMAKSRAQIPICLYLVQ